MFGNNFFPQFFVLKNKKLVWLLKKKQKTKKYFYITNYEGNRKQPNGCF